MRKDKKWILVTGASQGIGLAIADIFAQKGFDLLIVARKKDSLDILKIQFQLQYPDIEVGTLSADLSKKEGLDALSSTMSTYLNAPEVLVNNVGYFVPGQTHTEEDGVLESMIETNLYSAYKVTRMVVPRMLQIPENFKGHIFNICSTASITPYTNGGSYCISKYALYGFTQVLRQELKDKGIKVTAILPGATLTASWDGVDIPTDRFMQAQDVAKQVWAAYDLSAQAVVEEIVMRPILGDL